MTVKLNLLAGWEASRPARTLGIRLGARAVGLAVTTVPHVVHFQVLNLCKLTSQTGKEARFRQVVQALLTRHAPARLLLVPADPGCADTPLVCALTTWLAQEAARCELDLRVVEASAVRQALCPPALRPSGRALAEALATRFEAVRHLAPSREPVPGVQYLPDLARRGRRTRSSRQLYWQPMFLALGAAVLGLEDGQPVTSPPAYDPPHPSHQHPPA